MINCLKNCPMKKLILVITGLGFTISSLYAQTYKIEDTTLSIFKINDTLKYFEFYSPGFAHEDVEIGILFKVSESLYKIKYTNGPFFSSFNIQFEDSAVRITNIEKIGWIATPLRGVFYLKNSQAHKAVSQFHLNFPTFYKAKNADSILVYEYPCFESKTKLITFKKGSKIEEKWGVGIYNKYKPIITKTWIAVVCGNKFIGWLLLSDVEANFEKQDE